MGLPDGQKSFKIGLVVLIQYRLRQLDRQTPRHPPSHDAVASMRYAYLRRAVKIKDVGKSGTDLFTTQRIRYCCHLPSLAVSLYRRNVLLGGDYCGPANWNVKAACHGHLLC